MARSSSSLPATLRLPHPARLAPDHPRREELLARHEAAIDAGRAFYLDPETGFWVMTAAKLWERACCHCGCRHCPWIDQEARLAAAVEAENDGTELA